MINKEKGKRVYGTEKWLEAKRLYQEGLTLEEVGKKLGIPYPTVRYHGWVEDWGVRTKGEQKDPKYEAAKAKRIRRVMEKEEKRLAEELVVVKAEDLELMARKSLVADSARAKVTVSRLVKQTLEELSEPGVKAKERAATLQMLAPVIRLVHRWHEEPNLEGMERRGAINLALIATSPEELARLRLPAREDQSSLAPERRSEGETE